MVCEKHPTSTIKGYTTLSVCIAIIIINWGLVPHRRKQIRWSNSIRNREYTYQLPGDSSPHKDLESICNRTICCCAHQSWSTKCIITASTSPSWQVPLKITEICCHRFQSEYTLFFLENQGDIIKQVTSISKTKAFSSKRSLNDSTLLRGTPDFKNAVTTLMR